MPLNAQILLSVLAHETTNGDISRTLRATPATYALALTDGTGASQAQVVWSDAGTIPTSSSGEIDLTALADDRGTIAMTSIKAIVFKNVSAQAPMSLIQPQALAWDAGPYGAGEISIPPGGMAMFVSPTAGGWPVAAGASLIDVANTAAFGSGLVASYEIILIGEGTIT
jgi:hypothetical protein